MAAATAHLPVIVGIALCLPRLLGGSSPPAETATVVVCNWITIGQLHVPIEFRIDGLTTMMLAMVTFVSTLVAIFAIGLHGGRAGYPRFFAVVGLFVVLDDRPGAVEQLPADLRLLGRRGLCSYLLVGFWYREAAAAAAAKKAFLVNRVGDVGFAIAIFWLWTVGQTMT